MVGEALGHGLRGHEHVGGVAAAVGLALVERLAHPHRHERVLQPGTAALVGVHVAGGHRRHPQALGQRGQPAVAAAVVAREGPLELHPEAMLTEDPQQAPAGLRGLGVAVRSTARASGP